MKINQWAVLGLAALAAVTIACGGGGGSNGNGGGGSTGAPPGEASPAKSAAENSKSEAAAGSAADSSGTPQADFRGTTGTDRVNCASIDTQLAVRPYRGQIVWTATALDQTDQGTWPLRGNVLGGVSLSPDHGVLPDGQTAVVHISGSVTGLSQFAVVVSAPNHSGTGWVTNVFQCV